MVIQNHTRPGRSSTRVSDPSAGIWAARIEFTAPSKTDSKEEEHDSPWTLVGLRWCHCPPHLSQGQPISTQRKQIGQPCSGSGSHTPEQPSDTVKTTRKGYRKIVHDACYKITYWNCKITSTFDRLRIHWRTRMVGRKFTTYFVNRNSKIFCKFTNIFLTV